ncbi:Tar ligand binding domain-containing protein [Pseudorhodoferax sp. LjRoot39]
MNKLKISSRLALPIGILVVLMGGIGAIGLLGMGRTNAAFETVFHDRMEPLHALAEVQRLTLRNRMEATGALVDQRTDATRARLQSMEANTREIDRHWKRYRASAMTAGESEMAKAFEAARARFRAQGLLPMEEALLASRYEAVRTATLSLLAGGVPFALVVGRVVSTMQGIEEGARRMAEIISVIDGIAFQTKILALNAAAEAARAGGLVQTVSVFRTGAAVPALHAAR